MPLVIESIIRWSMPSLSRSANRVISVGAAGSSTGGGATASPSALMQSRGWELNARHTSRGATALCVIEGRKLTLEAMRRGRELSATRRQSPAEREKPVFNIAGRKKKDD